ncbi:hypothetical protein IPH19_01365 [Candidatus Uhrbacteria bacterium]|nr:MAG: hypothetical protein IPH19_01365 [Candidatus Uhrbacteria bacterium]
MKPALPTQIPLCGRRPPVIGALINAMQLHQRPFVLMMQEEDRHELVGTIKMMAERLGLVPFLIAADDTATQELYLLDKERHLLVIVETPQSRIPIGMQQFILERYEPPARNEHKIAKRMRDGASQREIQDSIPKAHPPAGLLVVTDTDPGELLVQNLWTKPFTELKQYTVLWDKMPQRPDAYTGIFRAGLTLAAREAKITLDGRVDEEAVARYARVQKILASHARKARERGMSLQAHQNAAEVLDAARDCVLYISHKADRRIDTNVIEALVFKGVTESAIKTTFGLAERHSARKSRPSFGPDAPFIGKSIAVGE